MCVTPFVKVLDIQLPHKSYFDTRTGELNSLGSSASIPLPCGKCHECKQVITNQWAFRLEQEAKQSNSALFVTLTYDDENVPLGPMGIYETLRHEDTQLFFKRLRKRHARSNKQWLSGVIRKSVSDKYNQVYDNQKKIKMFCVGEYGTRTWRPHYHAIIFNAHPNDIRQSWNYGHVDVGDAENGAFYYCLKYMDKPISEDIRKYNVLWDGETERRTMSRGLGLNYLTEDGSRMAYWHRDPGNQYVVNEKGYKVPIPRYYLDAMFPVCSETGKNPHRKKLVNHRIANWEVQDLNEFRRLRDLGGLTVDEQAKIRSAGMIQAVERFNKRAKKLRDYATYKTDKRKTSAYPSE